MAEYPTAPDFFFFFFGGGGSFHTFAAVIAKFDSCWFPVDLL